MSPLPDGVAMPRAQGNDTWRPLADLWQKAADDIREVPFDLRTAQFHPAADRRVTDAQLREWRDTLNDWAVDEGFPSPLNSERRSHWDVRLGTRLLEDTRELPEFLHPDIWTWVATHLLPHLVVYRWDWPDGDDDEVPTARSKWARFGPDLRNGLRLAMHRVVTYGPDLAQRASEQEFQSIQYRPAFGTDPRVARLILETLVEALDDPDSLYGKHGGSRTLDCNHVCIELRYVNSLKPLCFLTDDGVRAEVRRAIEMLPDLRERKDRESSSDDTDTADRPT